MNNFLKGVIAALLLALAAYTGAEMQKVLAERDYYRARAAHEAQQAELKHWENLINKYNPKF